MKKIITLFLTFISLNTYAQITFQKKFGDGGDFGYSAKQTSDGGYIIAGYKNNPQTDYDFYLVKTDSLGNMLWTKYFGTTGLDYGFSVIQTSDGGYAICGQTPVVTNNFISDVCLIKTDSNGNLMWSKTYGGSYWDYGYDVQQTNDGGYIIAGKTDSFGGNNVYLVKTDNNGNLVWSKIFGGASYTGGRSVKQTTDGGYIISGATGFGAGIIDVYLIKTDGLGNLVWSKTFGGPGEEIGQSVCQATDGGYIITGSTASFGAGMKDVYLIKTDCTGNMIWSKTFGGTNADFGYDVQQTSDGGIIITGGTYSFTTLVSVFLIKTNGNGNMLWSKIYGMAYYDFGFSVKQTSDSGFVLATSSSDAYFYLIKTNALGSSGCNESVPAIIENIPATQIGTPATIVNSLATLVTLPSFIIGNGGTVTAICSNSCTSPSAKITPSGLTTFCSGGNVVLNAPSGTNKTYQWKKGANLISGATSSSFMATTGGNYKVIVTNTLTGCSKTTGSAIVVTVNALPTATVTQQGPTTFCAGGSVVLAANTGTGLTYKWKKGSNFISGATLSNYTATAGGNYKVQVTNGNGCSKTSGNVPVNVPCKEGEIISSTNNFDFNVYPNPNSGEFTIKFSTRPSATMQIEMTDEIGRVVKQFATDDETIVIKESNLAKGIYCLTARNKDELVIKKISVVK